MSTDEPPGLASARPSSARPSRRTLWRRRSTLLVVMALFVGGAVWAVTELVGSDPTDRQPVTASPPVATSGSGSASAPASTAASASARAHQITFTAVGDTELGKAGQLPADPDDYLQPVTAALAAPIVFGNLEGTLTDSTGSKCGPTSTSCFAFRVPPSYAGIMRKAGFTVLNSANNHSHDFGEQGVADTKAALAAAGIAQTGLVGQIATVADGPTKVAFVGFAPYRDTNDLLDVPTATRLIAAAHRRADVVVVYMHNGAEGSDAGHVTGQEETYLGEDRGNAQVFARAAIDAGADAVIGSGPHVLRGMEFYKGHLIAYSLGNFANFHDFQATGVRTQSAILRVTLTGDGHWVGGQITSVVLSAEGRPAVDPTGAAARTMNALSTADFGPAAGLIAPIAATGQITPPGP